MVRSMILCASKGKQSRFHGPRFKKVREHWSREVGELLGLLESSRPSSPLLFFLSRGTLICFFKYLAAPLNEKIKLLFYKMWNLVKALTLSHGTPVGNHCPLELVHFIQFYKNLHLPWNTLNNWFNVALMGTDEDVITL